MSLHEGVPYGTNHYNRTHVSYCLTDMIKESTEEAAVIVTHNFIDSTLDGAES